MNRKNTGCRRSSCDKINPQEASPGFPPFHPCQCRRTSAFPCHKAPAGYRIRKPADTCVCPQLYKNPPSAAPHAERTAEIRNCFSPGCIPFSDRNAFFRIAAAPFRMPVRHQNAAHGRQSRFPSLCRHSSPPAGAYPVVSPPAVPAPRLFRCLRRHCRA